MNGKTARLGVMALPPRIAVAITVFFVAVAGFGCASSGGGSAPSAAAATPPPADSPLAQVAVGQGDVEVRKILGEPDSTNAYQTGKAWIPFYFGPDTTRMDYLYQGVGRVVFSRNAYSGQLRVIRVLYDPAELQ